MCHKLCPHTPHPVPSISFSRMFASLKQNVLCEQTYLKQYPKRQHITACESITYFNIFSGFQVTLTSGMLQFDSLGHDQTAPISLLLIPPPPPPLSPEVDSVQQEAQTPSVQQKQKPRLSWSFRTGESRGNNCNVFGGMRGGWVAGWLGGGCEGWLGENGVSCIFICTFDAFSTTQSSVDKNFFFFLSSFVCVLSVLGSQKELSLK